MNRRDFLKTLAAIPALPWLKPELPEVEAEAELELVPSDEVVYFQEPQNQIRWNGAGDSWETTDGEETWVHTNSGFSFGPDNMIYVGGEFVTPGIITNDEYWARWNGQEFERLDTIEGDLLE